MYELDNDPDFFPCSDSWFLSIWIYNFSVLLILYIPIFSLLW